MGLRVLILHLGVIDQAYNNEGVPAPLKRATKRKPSPRMLQRAFARTNGFAAPAMTTAEVATILEGKYHLFEVFYELNQQRIADAFAESAAGALENVMLGALASLSLTADAEQEIERRFKDAISQKAFDGIIPGVPTLASLKGVNHRLKHPYAKANPSRPSFRDTGLLQASFKAWTTTR